MTAATYPTAALPFTASIQLFGSQQPTFGPAGVRITQTEFEHDIIEFETWADNVNADSYQSGMPMIATFGLPLVKRSVYGYVNHAERSNNALSTASSLKRNSTYVVCAGSTYWMKQTSNQVWYNTTASQVITQIAQAFGFDTDIVPDSTVWPCLAVGGQKIWQFCVGLAKRIGYTFYGNGVQLVFKPRSTNPKQVTGPVAVFDYRSNPSGMPVFQPQLGATSPNGGQLRDRQLAGVDPSTSQAYGATVSGSPQAALLGKVQDTPLLVETCQATTASAGEATAKVQGTALSNQLYITAQAIVNGDPLISQGSLVYIANANGAQNGLWFVTKAVHEITKQNYTTTLSLGRDSLGATAVINGVPPTTPLPAASLSGGMWVAA